MNEENERATGREPVARAEESQEVSGRSIPRDLPDYGEPWTVHQSELAPPWWIEDVNGTLLFYLDDAAIAARVCAAVNACEGAPSDALLRLATRWDQEDRP